ncbi:MBL fold metallo-hydrolase [Panacagrimonas sp.]|uniref:MBL fold metallo-hydrolase n=1 Tax=Panacagrimonas sp. TaxID=2480088 RepID=UPI003B51A34B
MYPKTVSQSGSSALRCDILPVTPFQQNCSLIWDTDTRQAALVDAGGEIDRLLARVQHHELKLEKLLVTHGHLDHASAVAELAERYGLPIEGPHEDDQFWIDLLPQQAAQFGFPPAKSFTPDRWLHHGDTVELGSLRLDVLHCPGHTPGHVVLHHAPSQLAFVGDVIFQGSIGRTDFPRGNHADLIRSIRERLFALGDEVRFVPGHGPMSTLGAERQFNPFVRDPTYG